MSTETRGLGAARWFFGEQRDEPLQWAAGEAARLVAALTGRVGQGVSGGADACDIAVGSPGHHSIIRAAGLPELGATDGLGPDDYVLRSVTVQGRPVLCIAGKNDRAAMYGLFAFFETLGCRFLLSRDVVPEADPGLVVPRLDTVGRTRCSWRAVWLSFCFVGNAIMSLPDYDRLFAQLAKMRMNRVVYYHFENEPFMDYAHAGERRLLGDVTHPDSAYLSLGRQDAGTFRVADIEVGGERFDRDFVAPREFQHVRGSAEALDTGRAFMQELIRLAGRRGLRTWISFDPAFISLNLSKYTRRMARPHELYCALTSFMDPVVTEINRDRVRSLVASYPDIEGILLQITEGAYEDPYPDSQALIDAEVPKYREAFELLQRHWGKWWRGEEVQRTYLRGDIGFVERMRRTLESIREIRPDLPVGVLTVCKAYLLTHLDRVLPKDMPFVDIESQSLWTLDGAPLHLFDRMAGRECVLVPRAYDDGSLAGLQFDLGLYQRDGFLGSRAAHGTSGLCVQLSHVAGNDHNVRFLAEGMWNEGLAPEAFYRDYASAVFGPEAATPLVEAFAILEKNEAALGGRGLKNLPYSLNPPELATIRQARAHRTPFWSSPWSAGTVAELEARAARFAGAMAALEAALGWMEKARESCRAAGRGDLEYLVGKTRAYHAHLQTLRMLADVYGLHRRAFDALDASGPAACRDGLRTAWAAACRTEENAAAAARGFAESVLHPTDLAVIWMMNHVLVACRVARQFIRNVLAFYEGREYWERVDWALLYGESPFPTHQVEGSNTLVLG